MKYCSANRIHFRIPAINEPAMTLLIGFVNALDGLRRADDRHSLRREESVQGPTAPADGSFDCSGAHSFHIASVGTIAQLSASIISKVLSPWRCATTSIEQSSQIDRKPNLSKIELVCGYCCFTSRTVMDERINLSNRSILGPSPGR
jgi:hypothetical protein